MLHTVCSSGRIETEDVYKYIYIKYERMQIYDCRWVVVVTVCECGRDMGALP